MRDLEAVHLDDNIYPVVYGDSHDDLGPYLMRLSERVADAPRSESGLLADAVAVARDDFESTLKAALIGDSLTIGLAALDDVALPPILLHIPHAQEVDGRGAEKTEELSRVDAESDAFAGGVIVLAGDENTGRSFAADWLALKASLQSPHQTPVHRARTLGVTDYRDGS